MKKSRLIAISLLAGTSWVVTAGCGASGGNGSGPAGSGGNGGVNAGGSGGSSAVITSGSGGGGSAGKSSLNPLCGVADVSGECVPDDPNACLGYTPPSAIGGDGAGGQSGAAQGGAAQGGAGDAAGAAQGGAQGGEATSAAGQGGVGGTGQAGEAGGGAGGEGGSGSNQPPGFAQYSCQVTSQNNLLTRQCVMAGTGTANAPCFGAADCAPSFACVTDGDAGRCLPYCCDSRTSCAPGTYCAEQPLRRTPAGSNSSQAPRVPVCVPADGCSLEDQFPCPAGKTCRCQADTACMVVRNDGTTACVKPGAGKQGEACPCAWNHVCSSVTSTCVKICRTDAASDDCGSQKCQASAELPPNFGVCVGPN